MAKGRSQAPFRQLLASLPDGLRARALAVVGTTELSRLKWLLELLNRLPTETQLQDRLDRELDAQIAVFCDSLGSIVGGRNYRLTAHFFDQLTRNIRDQITAMLQGSTLELEIMPVTLVMAPGARLRYIGAPESLFRLAVAKLIESQAQRIKICARIGCGRLFVRRKRGLYCSRKCSQIEQFSRYIERHRRS